MIFPSLSYYHGSDGRIATVFGCVKIKLTMSFVVFVQIIGTQQYKMANMLQGIQEIGSHAMDIYDYLLAGLGR